MSIVLTIFTGIFVFIGSQYLLKIIVEPIVELKKTIGMISYTLLFYRSRIVNSIRDVEAANEIKTISAKLLSMQSTIPMYGYIYKALKLPSKCQLIEASQELNLIQSFMREDPENHDDKVSSDKNNLLYDTINKIGGLLEITVTYSKEE